MQRNLATFCPSPSSSAGRLRWLAARPVAPGLPDYTEKECRQETEQDFYSLMGTPEGLTEEQINTRLAALTAHLDRASATFAGYQVNLAMDYSPLAKFLNYSINNAGDPFVESNYKVNSRVLEQQVLEFFADLYHAPKDNYWGYITNGGTEANMYGLHVGRSVLEADHDGRQPLVYYSEDTHFSVRKIAGLLRFESRVIPSTEAGQIRIDELLTTMLANDPQQHPPLLVLNLGTSFKGAYDDVEAVISQLAAHGVRKYYIHVDAALGGLFLPFLAGGVAEPLPLFDFRLPIGSIAVSGHKCIGAPFPCGVVLTRREHLQCTDYRQIEYLGSPDTTISCSRNGLASLLLWYAIAKNGRAGLTRLALHMLEMADYAMHIFTQAGYKPRKNRLGLSVVFERPPQWVVEKWSLSTQGDLAHVFTMGHLNKTRLQQLAADLRLVKQAPVEAGHYENLCGSENGFNAKGQRNKGTKEQRSGASSLSLCSFVPLC